jgi:uncharacterized protein (TIGR03067 family)
MSRIWTLVWLILMAALAPAAPALKNKPATTAPIFGEWFRVGHTEAGAPVSVVNERHHQVFTSDGQWQYWYGDRPATLNGNGFVTDTKQNPPTIDISMGAGAQAQYRGIYKVEGDTLTLCVVTGDKERPKTFESSADKVTTIWVFKRVKEKD